MIKYYADDYGNTAIIAAGYSRPYEGAPLMKDYTLSCIHKRDKRTYFLSVFETMEEALEKLKEFSCGTFREF